MPPPHDAENRDRILARLCEDGILRREGARFRTTRRWQAAMMRSAARLVARGERDGDLRFPVAEALLELYGDALSESDFVDAVVAMTVVENAELAPARDAQAPITPT
ncbi:MAG TPA: hypothetical protein VM681_03455 [Candidatus Thermoplasmatota archaeon]|nr:hypothetical protein [Candidatus Thermoplasmatota archaeon]